MRLAGVIAGPGAERRRRRVRRHGHPDADPARGRQRGVAARRARAGRAARGAGAAARSRAGARLHAALGPLRRRLREPIPTGLTLDLLERSPHGDRPRDRSSRGCRRCCARRRARSSWRRSRSSRDLDRLRAAMARERNGGMVLIGRRQLRSNNSWMHNLPGAREGQGALHAAHPPRRRGAARARGRRGRADQLGGGLDRGAGRGDRRTSCPAWCRSRTAGATTPPGVRMGVASAHAGVNSNVLADESHGRAAVRERCPERDSGRGERAKWR